MSNDELLESKDKVLYEAIVDVAVPEYHSPINDVQKIRRISIQPLNQGYIVEVGCSSFAISSKKDLLKYLKQYIESPSETERKFYNNQLFKD